MPVIKIKFDGRRLKNHLLMKGLYVTINLCLRGTAQEADFTMTGVIYGEDIPKRN